MAFLLASRSVSYHAISSLHRINRIVIISTISNLRIYSWHIHKINNKVAELQSRDEKSILSHSVFTTPTSLHLELLLATWKMTIRRHIPLVKNSISIRHCVRLSSESKYHIWYWHSLHDYRYYYCHCCHSATCRFFEHCTQATSNDHNMLSNDKR